MHPRSQKCLHFAHSKDGSAVLCDNYKTAPLSSLINFYVLHAFFWGKYSYLIFKEQYFRNLLIQVYKQTADLFTQYLHQHSLFSMREREMGHI